MNKLEQTIINIVEASQGIKSTTLLMQLACSFLELDAFVIDEAIKYLVEDGFIREMTYMIPDHLPKKFYMPKGTVWV